jgi:hypothetical protein
MRTTTRRELVLVAVVSSVLTALLLGGGVAVALNVPNNSVNSAKVANNSLKSEDLRNGTILDADLNRETRTYWGLVEFNAGIPTLVAGEGVLALQEVGNGSTNVIWAPNITNCAIQATMQSIDIEEPPSRLIVTAERFDANSGRDGLFVQTTNTGGTFLDPLDGTGWAITVNC